MKCILFLSGKFELTRPARLVWDAPVQEQKNAPTAPLERTVAAPAATLQQTKELGNAAVNLAAKAAPPTAAVMPAATKLDLIKKHHERLNELMKDEEYKDKVKAFFDGLNAIPKDIPEERYNQKQKEAKEKFLQQFTDQEKLIVQLALDEGIGDEEKKLVQEKHKELPKDLNAIQEKIKNGEINLREGKVLNQLLIDSKTPAAVPTEAATNTLYDKIKKWPLIGDIIIQIAEWLGLDLRGIKTDGDKKSEGKKEEEKPKEEPAKPFENFESSPLGKTGDAPNLAVVETPYKEKDGIKIKIDKPESPIYSVIAGAVTKGPEEGTVTITHKSGQAIIYKGVISNPNVKEVKAGEELGKSVKNATSFSLQYMKDEKEVDPTDLLKPFTKTLDGHFIETKYQAKKGIEVSLPAGTTVGALIEGTIKAGPDSTIIIEGKNKERVILKNVTLKDGMADKGVKKDDEIGKVSEGKQGIVVQYFNNATEMDPKDKNALGDFTKIATKKE